MQQNQNQDQSTSFDYLWGVGAFIVLILLLWLVGKSQIIRTVTQIKYWQLQLLAPFSERVQNLQNMLLFAKENARNLDFSSFQSLLIFSNQYFRVPQFFLLLLAASYVYFTNHLSRFKREFNMKELMLQERTLWPQINPLMKEDLVKQPLDEGVWAMAMTPMEFCQHHDLLETYQSYGSGTKPRERGIVTKVRLKKRQAKQVLTQQLGAYWSKADYLSLPRKALFVIFTLRIQQKKEQSNVFLKQIANSSTSTASLDFSGIDELFKDLEASKKVQAIIQKHAYEYTVMAALLEAARIEGVLSSAEFLWLKPIDRTLWYVLNNVGRQTPMAEAAGIFAHHLAEKELGRRLSTPMVDTAVDGLEKAIAEILYQPENP